MTGGLSPDIEGSRFLLLFPHLVKGLFGKMQITAMRRPALEHSVYDAIFYAAIA
jgi:hypothetical protein